MYYPNSVAWPETKAGQMRRIRLSEINLATTLYGYSVRYNEVWIHRGSYLPFNLQDNYTAMTPEGEMWFQEGVYQEDFASPYINGQHLFLHEMMHVWQYQRGMWVRTRGAFSWAADYTYSLDKNHLLEYGLEQQASLVSDYWLLKNYGFLNHANLYKFRDYIPSEKDTALLARYEKILGGFPA